MKSVEEFNSYKRLDVVVSQTTYRGTSTETYANVVRDFNQERPSIMTTGYQFLFKHRRIKPSEYRLVHRNNVPELVPFSETPQRRAKTWDMFTSSSTLVICDQNKPLIGAFGHYVITVPIGQYAKVIENNEARLLGPGKHVIHSNSFHFEPTEDLVNQNENLIQHKDITILRVPPGKIASIFVDGEPLILESRTEPYVFKTQQLSLLNPLFTEANTKSLRVASMHRLLPDLNEVAVVNVNGKPQLFQCTDTKKEGKSEPIVIDDPGARFDGFLSLNLVNLEFPSAATKDKRRADKRSSLDQYYDKFYTSDRVEVGVKFFVCYRIKDPAKLLEHLKLSDVQAHIEGVVNTDMGRAIQRTSSQHLLSSALSKTRLPEAYVSESSDLPVVTESHEFWQDEVKTKLTQDLDEYGIELVRLNIEEAKILNAELESQMAAQATTVAEAEAKLAALATIKQVQERELTLQREARLNQAEMEQQSRLIEQETEFKVLEQRADAELKAARINAQRTQVESEAEAKATKLRGSALEDCPQMFKLKVAEQYAGALQNGHFSSSMPLSDLWQAFLKLLNLGPSTKSDSQAELLTKHSGFMRRSQSCGALNQLVSSELTATSSVLQ